MAGVIANQCGCTGHVEAMNWIRRVPGWEGTDDLALQPLTAGLTNQSFYFERLGEPYVLRICGVNSAALGINRRAEYAAYQAAAAVHGAPEVRHAFWPEGHMVRQFVPGNEWTWDRAADPDLLLRGVDTLKRVHGAGPIPFVFSPVQDVISRLDAARRLGLSIPAEAPSFLERAADIEARFWCQDHRDVGLCHNDAFVNNFLETDSGVMLMDWEFGGMGDVFYDLASLGAQAGPEIQEAMLTRYFGSTTPVMLEKFDAVRWLTRLWNWTWAFIQTGTGAGGQQHADYEVSLFARVRDHEWRW
jgi:thiamine kinase-like enzyme